jgi:capsular polysaccharide transport system permease protein
VFCALEVLTSTAGRVRGPLLRPLFWCSGLFFTANGLPSNVRDILLYNPVLHVIEIVRDGWFPSYEAQHASAGYAMAWMLCLLVLGLLLERVVRRKIEVT